MPIVSAGAGFIGFHLVDAGNGIMATISLFETEAANWVKENLAALLPDSPKITAGKVGIDRAA